MIQQERVWKRAFCFVFACESQSPRPESIAQCVELGVTPICDATAATCPDRRGEETRHTRIETILQNPLYNVTRRGMNALSEESQVRVQKTGMYNHNLIRPGHPSIISMEPES